MTQSRWAIPFFTLWSGQALSLLGSRITNFAVVWWLTQETNSAMVLTTLTLMIALPQIFLGPFAGALTDRWDRRTAMLVADTVSAIVSACLVLLIWADQLQIWHIYAVTFVSSLSGILQLSAMTASTSLMVPKEQLGRVQGANQILRGSLIVLAPIIGAILVDLISLDAIVGIDVVTALFAVLPLLFITVPSPTRDEDKKTVTPKVLWNDVVEGIQYIRAWRGLLLITLIEMFVNLVTNPVPALVPILVTENFQAGAMEFAWMRIAMGLGLLVGGILLSVWSGFKRRILMVPLGIIGLSLGTFLMGISPASGIPMAIVGIALGGFMIALINGTLMAVLQSTVAPEIQGRVFTVLNSTSMAAQPIGLLIAGPVAETWGAPVWFIFSGIVTLILGVSIFFSPQILNLQQPEPAIPAVQP